MLTPATLSDQGLLNTPLSVKLGTQLPDGKKVANVEVSPGLLLSLAWRCGWLDGC